MAEDAGRRDRGTGEEAGRGAAGGKKTHVNHNELKNMPGRSGGKKRPAHEEDTIITSDWQPDEAQSLVDRLSDRIGQKVPWGKSVLCAGIVLESSRIISVLLLNSGGKLSVKDAAKIGIEGRTYAEGLKSAVRTLVRRWKLGRAENFVSLSSNYVAYKFITLPGLSSGQMQQAVSKQLQADYKWDPAAHYLTYAPVGAVGNQTRVFACYVEQELLKSILDVFSSEGVKVYAVEPEVVSLHRALVYGGILEGRVLALIDVSDSEGRISLLAESGVMLSRSLAGRQEGINPDEEGVEAGSAPSLEGLNVDIAAEEVMKSCNYYEYSISAGKVDVFAIKGEGVLVEPLRKRLENDFGLEIEDIVIDIELTDEAEYSFNPLTHGAGLGAILSGVKWR